MGQIQAVCMSKRKGTVKQSASRGRLLPAHGLEGDAHAGTWHRQVSLLPRESINGVRSLIPDLADGAFAENLITFGLDLGSVSVGDRFLLSSGAELEVTQIGKECHHGCVIRQTTGDCIMPREGVFCRVLRGGEVRPGTTLEHLPSCSASEPL
jgi:MOSC domain-containing protein YiiM